MMLLGKTLALAMGLIILMGCDPKSATQEIPPPQEAPADSVGHYCGMLLSEHPGPKGQIFVGRAKVPVWFASVRETFAFTMLPEEPKNIVAIYVTDMGEATNWDKPEAGTWIDATKAYYVIGGRRQGGMGGDESVPFREAAQAHRFASESGGRVVTFDEMPRGYILQYGDEPHEERAGNDR